MAAAGIASVKCDYQTADHNVVYHNGYNGGWSSGISFNSSQWYDSYSGFHNIVSNNIVAGSYDSSTNHSDGNGIIMDLSNGSYTASSANTPAALIANNVVYGNGGRCIENFIVSNIWVVNNTCYDNTLDTSQPGIGEIVNNNSKNIHYVNNVVKAWNSSHPFQIMGSYSTGITYSSNLIYGGSNSGASGSGFTTANPQFVNPPSYNATSGGQYANTISPTSLGNGLNLQSTSPAINAGIDPISLTSNSNLKSDMSSCIYQDINGNARPVGGPFTLGAYQH
jgi:serralysin